MIRDIFNAFNITIAARHGSFWKDIAKKVADVSTDLAQHLYVSLGEAPTKPRPRGGSERCAGWLQQVK